MSKRRITVRLSEDQFRQIEKLVSSRDVASVSDCIRCALESWLRNQST